MSYCVTLYGSKIDVIMQLAKPAGLSQHSDTLKEEEQERKEKWEKRTEMKSMEKVVSRCVSVSIWTQAVFWQIYYSRPVLNFELCSSIYRRNCFTPSHCLMSFSAHFLLLLTVEKETRKTFSNVYPLLKSTPTLMLRTLLLPPPHMISFWSHKTPS